MNNEMYVIEKAEPFNGRIISTCTNGTHVDYTDGKTLDEFARAEGHPSFTSNYALITWDELKDKLDQYYLSRVSKPEEITEDEYLSWLDCLPPCRASRRSGVFKFHFREGVEGELVRWFAIYKDRFFQFIDLKNADDIYLTKKVIKAYEEISRESECV